MCFLIIAVNVIKTMYVEILRVSCENHTRNSLVSLFSYNLVHKLRHLNLNIAIKQSCVLSRNIAHNDLLYPIDIQVIAGKSYKGKVTEKPEMDDKFLLWYSSYNS